MCTYDSLIALVKRILLLQIIRKLNTVIWASVLLCCIYCSNAMALQYQPNTTDPHVRLLQTTRDYKLAVAKKDTAGIAETCYLLGKRNIAIANYAEAQKWLLKALDLRKTHGTYEDIGKIYMRQQEIQLIMRAPEQSLHYGRKALENFTKFNHPKGLLSAYSAIGTSYLLFVEMDKSTGRSSSQTQLDSAIYYLSKSSEIAAKIDCVIDVAEAYRHLVKCWLYKGDFKRSSQYTRQAINIFRNEKFRSNELNLALDVAWFYLEKSNLKEANYWLKNAQELVPFPEIKYNLKQSLQECLAIYFEQKGDWKSAYFHRANALLISSEQLQLYRSQSVENIRKSYENELKEIELGAKRNEIRILQENADTQQRMTWAITGLFFLTALTSILFAILYRKYRSLSNYNATLIREQSHRTKNNLQSVCDLLSLQMFNLSDDSTIKVLQESLLRVEAMTMVHHNLYQNHKPSQIDMHRYIKDLTTSILRIYRLENVTVSFNIGDQWLDSGRAMSVGLILNELITNACKYGLQNLKPALFISCFCQQNQLFFIVKDNGPGLETGYYKEGFGSELIRLLVTQLKGAGEYNFENGCEYTFQIPDKEKIKTTSQVSTYTSQYYN